jgi:pyruvate/2-oxoglutarate dehydrogenase complex dihydrolipoamide dehydrogenase (E3) component
LPGSEKLDGVIYLQKHAQKVRRSSRIVVIGGGAVGVQIVTDIKEIYSEKSVTLIHSRETVMNRFHHNLHDIIEARCKELGIAMRLGSRVKVPAEGYPTDGSAFDVELEDGSKIPADFAVKLALVVLDESVCTNSITSRSYAQARHRNQALFNFSRQGVLMRAASSKLRNPYKSAM